MRTTVHSYQPLSWSPGPICIIAQPRGPTYSARQPNAIWMTGGYLEMDWEEDRCPMSARPSRTLSHILAGDPDLTSDHWSHTVTSFPSGSALSAVARVGLYPIIQITVTIAKDAELHTPRGHYISPKQVPEIPHPSLFLIHKPELWKQLYLNWPRFRSFWKNYYNPNPKHQITIP